MNEQWGESTEDNSEGINLMHAENPVVYMD